MVKKENIFVPIFSPLAGKTVAFLGDSITLGYGLTDSRARFSTLVCETLRAKERNCGITGTLMAKSGPNHADGNSYLDRINLIAGADYPVIFGGTNDYFWSDTPIASESGQDESRFADAVDLLFRRACNLLSPAHILILSPYPHHGIGNYQGGATWQSSREHDTNETNFNGYTMMDYVRVLNEKAAKLHLRVMDFHTVNGFDWKEMTIDGCHPNPAGHAFLAAHILPALLEMK